MRRAFSSFAAVALVLAAAVAHAEPTNPQQCAPCHPSTPAVSVTLTKMGCFNNTQAYNLSVGSLGNEGWAVFDPVNNVNNGIGNVASFGLSYGTYKVFGVGNVGSTGSSGSNFVTVVGGCYTPPPTCTDGDSDGFFRTTGCGTAVDCNDSAASIHPGATEVVKDGIDQDCNGYDLTIVVTGATYSTKKTTLTVTATSSYGSAASLTLAGYGTMTWNKRAGTWSKTVITSPKPATVTVSGFEGSATVAVP